MSDSIRNVGKFIAVGVLLAILLIGGFAVAGFKIPALRFPNFPSIPSITTTSNNGKLILLITDAPVNVTHLNVTIDNVQVLRDMAANESGWTALPFIGGATNVSLDLLTLHNVTRDLSVTEVPAGNYTKIRLDILSATVTYTDGTTEAVTVPPGHIDIIVHFEVKAGATTQVLIDMTADFVAVSHSGNLRPVLKAKATVITSQG